MAEMDIGYQSTLDWGEETKLFPVKLRNPHHFPIRVLTFMDEETGLSNFAVIQQFKSINVDINMLTYEHLRRDPKVEITVVDPQVL